MDYLYEPTPGQIYTDLLPRQQVARFLTEGLQRADALTRWQIYDIATRVLGLPR